MSLFVQPPLCDSDDDSGGWLHSHTVKYKVTQYNILPQFNKLSNNASFVVYYSILMQVQDKRWMLLFLLLIPGRFVKANYESESILLKNETQKISEHILMRTKIKHRNSIFHYALREDPKLLLMFQILISTEPFFKVLFQSNHWLLPSAAFIFWFQ